jgi:hypothetical protein
MQRHVRAGGICLKENPRRKAQEILVACSVKTVFASLFLFE